MSVKYVESYRKTFEAGICFGDSTEDLAREYPPKAAIAELKSAAPSAKRPLYCFLSIFSYLLTGIVFFHSSNITQQYLNIRSPMREPMNSELFREIGLTSSEEKVYLALLELGDSTRGDIVNESGIAGSKVYEILRKLQEKGLVSIYMKDKVAHFKPTNPNQILSYLEKRKEKITTIEKQAKEMLPALLMKFNSSKDDQEVELLSGPKGLEVIFREQVGEMKKGETCYIIGGTWGTGEETESRVQNFFEKIHLMREEKGIKTKMLFNVSQKGTTQKLYSKKSYPGTETRYIEHTSPVAINVYGNKTIIIIFGKKISAIHIHSADVASSFMEYFNLLWKTAKS